jgi:UPF0755 protein
MLAGALASCLVMGGAWLGMTPAASPGSPTRMFAVASGSGVGAVGAALQQQGFIRSAWAFRLLAKLTGSESQIKAGLYALTPAMSPREMLRWMVQGKAEQTRLTFPEGYSVRQMAQLLEKQGVGSADRFMDLAADPGRFAQRFPWLADLPDGASLEGFLFPDTYEYGGTQLPEEALIALMLSRFEQVGLPAFDAVPSPRLDLFRTVTLASIVELEAQAPSERTLIAGVFYNRLRLRMPLGSDPTVEYALGWKQGSRGLSFKDVKVDSPYNTYKNAGLPPGPIANPGLASLKATLSPQETPLLYFVARGDGTHHFTKTYAEHLAAQRRIRQK